MNNVRQMPRSHQKEVKTRRKRRTRIHYFDYNLLAVIVFLSCFGLLMLYSTSSYSALTKYNDGMHYFKRQAIFCVAGFVGMYIASRIDYHIFAIYAKQLYWISIGLLVLVQTPLGQEVNGARRWIKLPFDQQFQPSEVTKIAVILFIPLLLCRMGKEINTLKGLLCIGIWGGFAAACVFFLTENLSTAIIVMGISCFLVFVVHPKTRPFLVIAAAGVIGLMIVTAILKVMVQNMDASAAENFRLRRVLVWLQPEKYAANSGFQVMQGLYAVGSGGFFGKGLGNSAQKMIIPEVQNDMILSIICEELGIFGAIMVLMLFGLLLYRLMFIAQNAPDMYGALVATGIFAHIAIQVVLNVAVVINLIPTTGITLPFISYGGTSILFLMAEMGLALGISRKIHFDE